MKPLNGWQRLWVVCSVIWLVSVAAIVISEMPKKHTYKVTNNETGIVIELIGDSLPTEEELEKLFPIGEIVSDFKPVSSVPADKKDSSAYLNEHPPHTAAGEKDSFDRRVNEANRNKLNQLRTKQLSTIGVGLLAWIIPVIAVYVLGYSVGWVIRGFKKSSPNNA